MATSLSSFLTNSWTRWVGGKEQPSTSTSSATGSYFGKSDPTLLNKLAFLLEENHRLKEEIRLLKASKDKTHDV
jgi:hypothetical protein